MQFPGPQRLTPCELQYSQQCSRVSGSVFFFQAEDGIRDLTVTGVQTCALPISRWAMLLRRIVSEVFLNYANGLECGHSMGHTGHPVPFRDTQQLLMHQEAIGEEIGRASCRERV